METAIESFQKGYEAMGAVREDMASKDILSQVYAGQTPEDIKDPIKQAATLNQAAGMLQSKGLASAAYKLQKQAGDLNANVSKQQLDELKVKQGVLEYAGQMLQGAATDSDLNEAFSGVKDTLAQAQIQRVIRMDVPFEKKKQILGDMAKTVDQNLRAQQLTLTATKATQDQKNKEKDDIRADQRLAFDQIKVAVDTGLIEDTPAARAKLAKSLGVSDLVSGGKPSSPSALPAPDQSAEDWAKANGIPVSPHGGTRDTQGQADQVAAWYKGGMKGPRPAEPGTSKHEKGNAIDVPEAGRTPENRAKLEAAGFTNPVKGEPWHFERETPKAAPAPSAADKKAAAEVSLPTETNPTGTPPAPGETKALTRKGAGKPGQINERLAWGINEASLQAGADITNIAKLPIGSNLSSFAGMAGKTGSGFVSSLSNATARRLNSTEQRVFQQYVSGFEANMARALGGGYAASSTKQVMDAYKEQIAKEGDDPVVMAAFLARSKQELTLLNKAFKAHPGANAAEIKQNNEMLAELNKYVTWTVDDTTQALNATGKQSLAEAGQKLTGTGTAKAPAEGTIMDGYRFKGGDPAKKESWEKV
jgi:hypothetical protein